MLKISKMTDYATLILSYLAILPNNISSAAEIAAEIHLSTPTVSKILKILLSQQLVHSLRGTGGGYKLARAADEITLKEIVGAMQGDIALTACCHTVNPCRLDALCGLKNNWRMIHQSMANLLSNITLQAMLQPLPPLAASIFKGIPIKKELMYDE